MELGKQIGRDRKREEGGGDFFFFLLDNDDVILATEQILIRDNKHQTRRERLDHIRYRRMKIATTVVTRRTKIRDNGDARFTRRDYRQT